MYKHRLPLKWATLICMTHLLHVREILHIPAAWYTFAYLGIMECYTLCSVHHFGREKSPFKRIEAKKRAIKGMK